MAGDVNSEGLWEAVGEGVLEQEPTCPTCSALIAPNCPAGRTRPTCTALSPRETVRMRERFFSKVRVGKEGEVVREGKKEGGKKLTQRGRVRENV